MLPETDKVQRKAVIVSHKKREHRNHDERKRHKSSTSSVKTEICGSAILPSATPNSDKMEIEPKTEISTTQPAKLSKTTTARPCPLSKKRKLEKLESLSTKVETNSISKNPIIKAENNIREDKIESSVKRLVAPCPRSKKKLQRETMPASTELESTSNPHTPPKKLARPCPLSKRPGYEKKVIKGSSSTTSITTSLSKTSSSSNSSTKGYIDTIKYAAKDSTNEPETDNLTTKSVHGEYTVQTQQQRKIISNVAKSSVVTPKLSASSSSIHNTTGHLRQPRTEKWKDALSKLQSEIGHPENLVDVITETLSPRQLLNLQKALNENKQLYMFELILHHVWMNLDLQDLLECRLVCRRWSNAVDSLLQNISHCDSIGENYNNDEEQNEMFNSQRPKSAFKSHSFVDRYGRECSTWFEFSSNDKIQSFREKTRDHPRNPFVTRSVLVRSSLQSSDVEEESFSSPYWTNLCKLFRKHGIHIWHLQLDIQGHHPVTSTYKMIRRLLEFVPNLRSLELLCHPARDINDDTTNNVESLPDLPFLNYLDLTGAKFPNDVTGQFIERYALKLKTLRVSLYRWSAMEHSKLVSNLRQLHVTAMCSQQNLTADFYPQLNHLQQLPFLTQLSFTLMVTLKANVLFGMLQRFEKLRTIRIVLLEHLGEIPYLQHHNFNGGDGEANQCSTNQPSLPQVNSLELSFSTAQRTFGFLKWFPNLTSLHLAVTTQALANGNDSTDAIKSTRREPTDRILRHLRRCVEKMCASKSLIWSFLPSVQILTVVKPDLHGRQVDKCFLREKCVKLDK